MPWRILLFPELSWWKVMSICQYCNSNHQSFCCEVTQCSTCCRSNPIIWSMSKAMPCPSLHSQYASPFPEVHVLASGAVLSCGPTNRKGDVLRDVDSCPFGMQKWRECTVSLVHSLIRKSSHRPGHVVPVCHLRPLKMAPGSVLNAARVLQFQLTLQLLLLQKLQIGLAVPLTVNCRYGDSNCKHKC